MFERELADSVAYLESEAALASLAVDVYWPKWHSPWWHMLLMWELGEARRIPARASAAVLAGIDGLLHTFPITPEETAGVNLSRDIACHCALGTMSQVLGACGRTMPPWVDAWFHRYQMADGGLNCDEEAYRVTDECPSSMVGTVSVFEAMRTDRAFAERAAQFMIGRELVHGSPTKHNADERVSAERWPLLTFPRFYFYDVLRGLTALVRWAQAARTTLPRAAVAPAIALLEAKGPELRVERNAHAGHTTLVPTADGSLLPRTPTTTFPLLDAVSAIGQPSEALTREWHETRAALAGCIK